MTRRLPTTARNLARRQRRHGFNGHADLRWPASGPQSCGSSGSSREIADSGAMRCPTAISIELLIRTFPAHDAINDLRRKVCNSVIAPPDQPHSALRATRSRLSSSQERSDERRHPALKLDLRAPRPLRQVLAARRDVRTLSAHQYVTSLEQRMQLK